MTNSYRFYFLKKSFYNFLLLFPPAVLETCALLLCMPYIHKEKKEAALFISLEFICIQSSTPLQDSVYEITQAKH